MKKMLPVSLANPEKHIADLERQLTKMQARSAIWKLAAKTWRYRAKGLEKTLRRKIERQREEINRLQRSREGCSKHVQALQQQTTQAQVEALELAAEVADSKGALEVATIIRGIALIGKREPTIAEVKYGKSLKNNALRALEGERNL